MRRAASLSAFWARSDFRTGSGITPPRYRGVSSSGSPLHAPLQGSRRCCLPMSRPEISIRAPASALSICCLSSMPARALLWYSSHMTSASPSGVINVSRCRQGSCPGREAGAHLEVTRARVAERRAGHPAYGAGACRIGGGGRQQFRHPITVSVTV